jgi:hypothetical protein
MSAARGPLPFPRPPGPGSTPLDYLKQHQSLDQPEISARAFRQAWRVRSRIDKLLVAEEITGFEWRCASEFRTLHEVAFGSLLRAPRLDGTGRGSGYRDTLRPGDQQRAALRRLRDLQARLDRDTVQLLELIIVMDLRWRELGKRLSCHACTAKRRAIAAIRRLATVSS